MEIIKAPACQLAPVRDEEGIEGALERDAEFSDDPVFPTVGPSLLRKVSKLRIQMIDDSSIGTPHFPAIKCPFESDSVGLS
jgi:hypothetical protein